MPIPVAQAGPKQYANYSTLPRLNTLTGAATNGPLLEWEWRMLSVPNGSTANIGANGDFTAGIYTLVAPVLPPVQFTSDIQGSYVLQLRARNATGWSDPFVDKAIGQTIIVIRTQKVSLTIPSSYEYNYGQPDLNASLLAIENALGGPLVDLQQAYDNNPTANPAILFTDKGFVVQDANPTIGANEILLGAKGPAGTDTYFAIKGDGKTYLERKNLLTTPVEVLVLDNPTLATGPASLQVSPAITWKGHSFQGGADRVHAWRAWARPFGTLPVNSEMVFDISYDGSPVETVFGFGVTDSDPKGFIFGPAHHTLLTLPEAAAGDSGFDLHVRPGKVGVGGAADGTLKLADIGGKIELLTTTTSSTGVIYKGATRFIHDYTAPGTSGLNTFVGVGSGNFTASGTGGESSGNVGVGYGAVAAFTTLYNSVGIGPYALGNVTTGGGDIAIGYAAARFADGSSANVCIGQQSMTYASGDSNVMIGYKTGFGSVGITGVSSNTLVGAYAGYSVGTNSTGNVLVGFQSGYSETGSNKLYISNSNTATPLIGGDFATGKVGLSMAPGSIVAAYLETPGSTTNSSAKFGTFELQSYATNNAWMGDNFYYSGGFKYRANGSAFGIWFVNGTLDLIAGAPGVAGDPMPVYRPASWYYNGKFGLGGNVTGSGDMTGAWLSGINGKVGVGTGNTEPAEALEVRAVSGSNRGVKIVGDDYGVGLMLYSTKVAVNDRNWVIAANEGAEGDLCFMHSSTYTGSPYDTMVLELLRTGSLFHLLAGVGTAQTMGYLLYNNTPAANGAQQYSALLALRGQGWDSDGGGDTAVEFAWQVQPVQGATVSGNLLLYSRTYGGGYTTVASFTSAGNFAIVGDFGASLVSANYFTDYANAKGYWVTNEGGSNWVNRNKVTTNVNMVVRAIAAQTADLTQWQDSTTEIVASVPATGGLMLPAKGGVPVDDLSQHTAYVLTQKCYAWMGGAPELRTYTQELYNLPGGNHTYSAHRIDSNLIWYIAYENTTHATGTYFMGSMGVGSGFGTGYLSINGDGILFPEVSIINTSGGFENFTFDCATKAYSSFRFAVDSCLFIRAYSAQTLNMQEWRDSSDHVLASVGPSGDLAARSVHLTAQGTQDSNGLLWQGHYFPLAGSDHTVDWRAFADVTSDSTGASAWTLRSRIDGAGYATCMTVDQTGSALFPASVVTPAVGSIGGAALLALGATTGMYVSTAFKVFVGLPEILTVTADAFAVKFHGAFTGSGSIETTDALQTTTATQDNLYTLTLTDTYVYGMEVFVTARNTSGAERGTWKLIISAHREGGSAVLDNGGTHTLAYKASDTPAGWDVTVDTSGNDVRVRVTGAAATTINWVCRAKYQAVSGSA